MSESVCEFACRCQRCTAAINLQQSEEKKKKKKIRKYASVDTSKYSVCLPVFVQVQKQSGKITTGQAAFSVVK